MLLPSSYYMKYGMASNILTHNKITHKQGRACNLIRKHKAGALFYTPLNSSQ